MLGGFLNVEGVDLRLRGKEPVVIPVDKLGVPTYNELVFVAQGQRLEEDSQPVRLFLAALARGTSAAAADPQAATEALTAANPDLDPRLTAAEVKATLPLLKPPQKKTPGSGGEAPAFGEMNPEKWEDFILWMRDHGLISGQPAPSEVLSNRYLPGRIP
jgi:putative hydroxymethylpyrimidine transport system substrate-binding protein